MYRQPFQVAVFFYLSISVMSIAIAVTVIITGGKEISDFTQSEMIIFYVFLSFEFIYAIAAFFFANKCGKLNPLISEKNALLKKNILNHTPLPSGNVLKAYINTDYTAKVVIFRYPNADDVYFIVQAVDKALTVITTYESEVFHDIEDLRPMTDELIDIS